jgi:hypothetical protein
MGGASIGMDSVFEVGLTLPDVEESPYYGVRALKLNGQMVACTPLNESAEVNSVVVAISFERRAALLKKSPSLYYITDHYAPHPTMLIRLSKISRPELERTLRMARDFAASKGAVRRSSGKARRRLVKGAQ